MFQLPIELPRVILSDMDLAQGARRAERLAVRWSSDMGPSVPAKPSLFKLVGESELNKLNF